MATLAVSNLSLVYDANSSFTDAGTVKEIWRLASGIGVSGDTIVCTPNRIRLVQSCFGGLATHNISGAGVTAVTLTLVSGTATGSAWDFCIEGIS